MAIPAARSGSCGETWEVRTCGSSTATVVNDLDFETESCWNESRNFPASESRQ